LVNDDNDGNRTPRSAAHKTDTTKCSKAKRNQHYKHKHTSFFIKKIEIKKYCYTFLNYIIKKKYFTMTNLIIPINQIYQNLNLDQDPNLDHDQNPNPNLNQEILNLYSQIPNQDLYSTPKQDEVQKIPKKPKQLKRVKHYYSV